MSFWFNKPETGSPYEAADRLFNQSVALFREPARFREAERCLASAIESYRAHVRRTGSCEAKRRLAKALWREAYSSGLIKGQGSRALASGQESLELGRAVLRDVNASHPALDAIVQEVSGAMNDIAQISYAAGRPKQRERLLTEAASVARRSTGSGGRQALGTALHNLAHHRLQHLAVTAREQRPFADIVRVLASAERAFEIRLALCEEPRVEPYQRWELASSALQLGQLLRALSPQTDSSPVLRVGLASLRDAGGEPVEHLVRELTVATLAAGAPADPIDEQSFPRWNIATLGRGAQVLLELIGLLEEDDRISALVSLWLPDIWHALEGPLPPPDLDAALAELVDSRLVTVRICEGSGRHYDLEYLVERCVRARVPDGFARDSCLSIARLWAQRFDSDWGLPNANPVRSGIAAAVYMRRGGDFKASFDVLEGRVLGVACRRREWRPVAVHMQLSADASEDREYVERCCQAMVRLARAHFVEGHAEEALEAAAMGLQYSLGRELGPSMVARCHEVRMDLLYRTGQHERVLDELDSVLGEIDGAREAGDIDSSESDGPAALAPVREATIHHAVGAAKALRRWQLALDLNRTIHQSLQARGAEKTALAAQRMGDYAPLLELGDGDSADALLRECQSILHPERERGREYERRHTGGEEHEAGAPRIAR